MSPTTPILQNDFKRQWNVIGPAVVRAVERVGVSGWYILGREVEAFEAKLAETWGLSHAVGTANGMDAIELALRCLQLEPGEKVLTTPLSAFATTLAIVRAGGVPVFVDVDDDGLIDLSQCREILERDRGIRFFVPVHLYGSPLDLDELGRVKEEFDLQVVEDCAQAIGAAWRETVVGSVGQVAATSFYPTKNLGGLGDGGALLTNEDGIRERAKCLRNYGQSTLYHHSNIGLNSRLDELQAAILHEALLPNLAEWTSQRQETAATYRNRIRNPSIKLPAAPASARPVYHLFPTEVAPNLRDQFREYLNAHGILTGIHYPRVIPDQSAMEGVRHELAFAPDRARKIALSEVSLPIHPFLASDEVERVIAACNDWKP